MTGTPAPIALFVYNRPELTRRALETLQSNPEAERSRLYIFADGPRLDATAETLEKIAAVKRVLREKRWCGEVEIVEADTNQGLRQAIMSGIDGVLERHEKVIVLEDDILVSPDFLRFMNDQLQRGEGLEHVGQVSAYMVPTKARLPSVGLFRAPGSWGWATWRRAWCLFNRNASELLMRVRERDVDKFNINGSYDYLTSLENNASGKADTWAVRWYASLYLHEMLTIYPRKTLTRNVGFSSDGTNCAPGKMGRIFESQRLGCYSGNCSFEHLSEEHDGYVAAFESFYRWQQQVWTQASLETRLLQKAKAIWTTITTGNRG